MYPALAKPTRYAVLLNQYVPRAEVDKTLAAIPSSDLQPMRFKALPSNSSNASGVTTSSPQILLLEHIKSASALGDVTEATLTTDNDRSFLFPQPVTIPLMSHWNMEAASALAAHMLDVQPGDRVLDLCVAPGGISIAIAQIIFHNEARGSLHANELDATRNKRLLANLQGYLPSDLFATKQVRVLILDAASPRTVKDLPFGPGGYDRVLLDAPCSSERHIIHAHLKASASGNRAKEMVRWSNNGSKTMAKTQADMLMTALRAVKTGGRVVCSTCSINTEENYGAVERMLAAVEKERKKNRLSWKIVYELGSERRLSLGDHQKEQDDEVMERLSEETKYGRIDHPAGGRWGPLYFCVVLI